MRGGFGERKVPFLADYMAQFPADTMNLLLICLVLGFERIALVLKALGLLKGSQFCVYLLDLLSERVPIRFRLLEFLGLGKLPSLQVGKFTEDLLDFKRTHRPKLGLQFLDCVGDMPDRTFNDLKAQDRLDPILNFRVCVGFDQSFDPFSIEKEKAMQTIGKNLINGIVRVRDRLLLSVFVDVRQVYIRIPNEHRFRPQRLSCRWSSAPACSCDPHVQTQ